VFAERGFENARLEAELLLAGVLGVKRLDLYLQHDRRCRGAELERSGTACDGGCGTSRCSTCWARRVPQAGAAVDPRVLIPRPETEVLVGRRAGLGGGRAGGRRVLDVGTGSGRHRAEPGAEGTFEARRGHRRIGRTRWSGAGQCGADWAWTGQVEFRQGRPVRRPWVPVSDSTSVVSNPPYVAERTCGRWRRRCGTRAGAWRCSPVRTAWRDRRLVTARAARHLEPGGLLALEIGAGQGDAVLALIRSGRRYVEERIVKDLAGGRGCAGRAGGAY
jgi:release factor glutamine methyltransferase